MTAYTKTCLRAFTGLLILLALTVAADFLPLGVLHTPVALGIAAAKAGLIAWFFMELHQQSNRVRLFATAGLIWLFILVVLTASDYATRGWSQ